MKFARESLESFEAFNALFDYETDWLDNVTLLYAAATFYH